MLPRGLLALVLAAQLFGAALAQEPGWPRELTLDRARLVYYEPQVDAWKDFKQLDFRLAFELTPANGKPVVGIGVLRARTDVNVDERTAVIRKIEVVDTRFPSADPAVAQRMDALFRRFIATRKDIPVSLDHLVAATEKRGAAPKAVAVRNDPPAIFVSYQPAILLQTDGKPVLARSGSDDLEFIVNANWPVFHSPAEGRYYLFNDAQWLGAARLEGPWSPVGAPPRALAKLLDDPQWADLKKAVNARDKPRAATAVLYSSTPAEVIIFDGKPTWSPIAGTQLVYASNTDADLFVDSRTNTYYFLAAGRWFRAASLDGPWTYATPELPPDFARIPQDSPAARVLASVPGTEAAKDAVLLAQVPTTVTLDPKEAAALVGVTYDGAPQFKPIEGTQLSYATNTPERVIKVGNQYYLCTSGVWFVADAPTGPWTTAPSVPSQIYAIPPSSPVYNVTYVTQTTAPDGYVNASYTAGYFGTFIMGAAVGAILAEGSGYYYPPYYHYPAVGYPVYRPYAATYGVGSYYNPYTGAQGVSRGVYGPARGATGSASFNPYTGTYARAGSAYGPYGSRAAGAAYNPYTGASARAGAVSGPRGSAAFAGARNPAQGTAAATRQASGVYGQWGASVVQRGGTTTATRHASTASGRVGTASSSTGARVVAGQGARGSAAAGVTASGDLYAGKDGNVYRRSGDTWQRYDNGSWSNTANQPGSGQARAEARAQQGGQARADARTEARSPSAARARPASQSATVPQNLNRDWQGRQRAAVQSERFASARSAGGGFRGGGRGGGRGR